MKVDITRIKDVKIITPIVFDDERGHFFEGYNQRDIEKLAGINCKFVQDNFSKSKQGVLRGLHFQIAPKVQGKLVRCINGEIFDVAVDLRKDSNTYGQWVGETLSDKNKKQLWIPEGFAHGFLTLSVSAEVMYKTTEYYDQDCERSIIWNDPEIQIKWPINSEPVLSEKDKQADFLQNVKVNF